MDSIDNELIEEWEDFKVLTNDDPGYWFAAAKWGKISKEYTSSERRFIFQVGKHLKEDAPMTKKQISYAHELFKKIVKSLFRYERRGKSVIRRTF